MYPEVQKIKMVVALLLLLLFAGGCSEQRRKERADRQSHRTWTNIMKRDALSEGVIHPFHLSEKPYEIGYIQNGSFIFYDIQSGDKIELPEPEQVCHFASGGDSLTSFYTVVIGDSLFLKKAVQTDSMIRLVPLIPLHKHISDFIIPPHGLAGNMLVEGDTLYLECHYDEEQMRFSSSLKCILNEEFEQVTMGNFIERRQEEMKALQKEEDAKWMKSIMQVKMYGLADFFLMSNDIPIRKEEWKVGEEEQESKKVEGLKGEDPYSSLLLMTKDGELVMTGDEGRAVTRIDSGVTFFNVR